MPALIGDNFNTLFFNSDVHDFHLPFMRTVWRRKDIKSSLLLKTVSNVELGGELWDKGGVKVSRSL